MKQEIRERIEKIRKGEVPAGYKKTENWILPSNWDETIFSSMMDGFSSGSTPPRNNKSFFKGDNIWITSGELNYNIIENSNEKITDEAIKKANLKVLNPGTFVIAITGLEAAGTRGSCGIVGRKLTTSQSCMALIPKPNLDLNFLFQFYCAFGEKIALKYTQGTKQQSYNGNLVRKLPIIKVPLNEQKKITEILYMWDKAIELKEKLIKEKKELKRGLMQKLLTGEMRFPEFTGEWAGIPLNNLVERITSKNKENNKTIITISAKEGFVNQDEYFNKLVASKDLSEYFLLKKGDFVYNKSYSNGYPAGAIKRLDSFENAVVTTLYICFRIKEKKVSSNFLKYYFDSGLLNNQIKRIANEGGRAHGLLNVTPNDFFNVKMNLPEYEEQEKISEILLANEQDIQLSEKDLFELKEQKRGLMQLLLTGIVRVNI